MFVKAIHTRHGSVIAGRYGIVGIKADLKTKLAECYSDSGRVLILPFKRITKLKKELNCV